MSRLSMCEECAALARHPHVAGATERLKELGVSEQTRSSGPPVVRKRYECQACHTVWTMTHDPAEPAEVWVADV